MAKCHILKSTQIGSTKTSMAPTSEAHRLTQTHHSTIPFRDLIQNNSRVIDDRRRFKVPRHVDIPSDPKKSPNINRFRTTLVKSMNLQRNQVLFDSGASTCTTSDKSILRNIVSCDNIKAYPAFGPPVQTKEVGQYGPLGLDMILLDDMKEILISISELSKGGILNQ